MLVGYVRVSKADGSQTLAPQRDAMAAAGVEPDRIYEDLASGRRDDRPGLAACLKALQPGNTLVLWKLDRLGRDLRHLVNTVDELRTRGVGLKVIAEGIETAEQLTWMRDNDCDHAQGYFLGRPQDLDRLALEADAPAVDRDQLELAS